MDRRDVEHHDHSFPRSDSSTSEERPQRWEVSTSVYGRGKMLYGPLDERVSLVLAPPAVPLPTPPNWQAPLASSGWRAAWLMPLADGRVILDEQEPFELETLNLAEVIEIVLDNCPQYLRWIAEQVTMRAGTTAFSLKPDRNGVLPAGAAHREAALIAMLADAERALAHHADRLAGITDCPLDEGWLEELRAMMTPCIDQALLAGVSQPGPSRA